MENELKKRYGLSAAISMVIGIVIGSGIFFKAQDVLRYTNGNMLFGVFAWLIGGAVMIFCALTFSVIAVRCDKANGIISYATQLVNDKYAYMFAWFLSTIYYPSLASVLSWVCAKYTLEVFGIFDNSGGLCMVTSAVYLILIYALNSLSPKLYAKLQISATVIKMIPLILMAIAGIISGIFNDNLINAFQPIALTSESSGILSAVVSAVFSYEGWIIATSISAELKNSKRNLPLALTFGTIAIIIIYVTYFVGLIGGASVDLLISKGSTIAFSNVFGNTIGGLLNIFVVVSCVGTLNGLMFANARSMYTVASTDNGPKTLIFKQIDKATSIPNNSGVIGLVFCVIWLLYYYISQFNADILGWFSFDSSELPIITVYLFYIPIFVMFIIKHGKENRLKNIVLPIFAIASSGFMVFATIYAHGYIPYINAQKLGDFAFPVLFYLIVFIIIMSIGLLFYKSKNKE